MDREIEYNTEMTKLHHKDYVRNSRAVVVLWAVFTIVFTVLNIVVFAMPQWIGDEGDSAVAGFFGLYRYCEETVIDDDYICHGDFLDWNSMLTKYHKACAVLVGVSCLLFIVCMACFALFCLLNTSTVLFVCAWFQLLSGFLMAVACAIYPMGWDHRQVAVVCGLDADQYDLGVCSLRWGYILAIVLVIDAWILSILAFVLAKRQANLLPAEFKDEKEPIKN